MLSGLGIKTKLDGNWLDKRYAAKIQNRLKSFHIDISRLFNKGEKQWNTPKENDIQNAMFVSLDPYFKNESLLAAELCPDNQKPYGTLDCKYNDFLAQNAVKD